MHARDQRVIPLCVPRMALACFLPNENVFLVMGVSRILYRMHSVVVNEILAGGDFLSERIPSFFVLTLL